AHPRRPLCIHPHQFYALFLRTPPPPEVVSLSLHDALPICAVADVRDGQIRIYSGTQNPHILRADLAKLIDCPEHQIELIRLEARSEEHTSELQSRFDLVCRLLLEKRKKLNPSRRERPRRKR